MVTRLGPQDADYERSEDTGTGCMSDEDKQILTSADPSTQEGGKRMPSMWGWQTVVSLIVALALMAFMVSKVDLRDVWQHLMACNKWYLLLGALWFLGHVCRRC